MEELKQDGAEYRSESPTNNMRFTTFNNSLPALQPLLSGRQPSFLPEQPHEFVTICSFPLIFELGWEKANDFKNMFVRNFAQYAVDCNALIIIPDGREGLVHRR